MPSHRLRPANGERPVVRVELVDADAVNIRSWVKCGVMGGRV
jgi:hypothetical protein